MINSVEDLKNRTLVESNTLRSFILSQNKGVSGFTRDDIMIHDYQTANSVTINSILSNYIVNMKYAWSLYDSDSTSSKFQYFKIIELNEDTESQLDESTRLILDMSDGFGSFKTREVAYGVEPVEIPENTVKFINLDTVWYGIIDCGEYDKLNVVDGMNNFIVNPNPFGVDPFDCKNQDGVSFNGFLEANTLKINCIVENLFRNSKIDSTSEEGSFGYIIPRCQYLVCAGHKLYGLESNWDNGEFEGFTIRDLGGSIPNIDKEQYDQGRFKFLTCGFNVVSEVCTMFVIFMDEQTRKYHYMYFNENTYDKTYGFTPIRKVVVDQLISDIDNVFQQVESMKSLDNVNIVLTNYGFWDIEPNITNDVTYSFRSNGKNYEEVSLSSWKEREDKLLLPTTTYGSNDKVVEYQKRWRLNSGKYSCIDVSGSVQYAQQIPGESGEMHSLVGATQTLAVYNSVQSQTDPQPVYFLVQILQDQFNELLFSTPGLVSPLIKWIYDHVVHLGTSEHGGYGEYFLWNNNGNFANVLWQKQNPESNGSNRWRMFNNYSYQIVQTDHLLSEDFDSVYKLIEKQHTGSGAPNLHTCCSCLNQIVTDTKTLEWLFGRSDYNNNFITALNRNFKGVEYGPLLDGLVETVLDQWISHGNTYSQLSYFRKYLKEHLIHDMSLDVASFNSDYSSHPDTVQKVISDVQDFIKSMTSASLVMAQPGYSGIQSYLYQTRKIMNRSDVYDIMSITNSREEIVKAVKSMKFFSEYNDYTSLLSVHNDTTLLFNITQNMDFARISNLVESSGNLKIDWSKVNNWLFGANTITDDKVLKAFIRTQFYRPMFFKYDNYWNFTSNEAVYKCTTDKYFVDHLGYTIPLVVNRSTGVVTSGPVDRTGYTIPASSVVYQSGSNVLEYQVNYNPIDIVDGKFVLNDMEFFCVVTDPVRGNVSSVCFNEFQKEMQPSNDRIDIDYNNRFAMDGVVYQIENDGTVLSVDDATEVFSGERKEFKGQIDNGFIEIDGVRYFVKSENGVYKWLQYAGTDDNKLVQVPIMDNGYGVYAPMGLHIQFDTTGEHAWERVRVVMDYQTPVIDRIKDEWCWFDNQPVTIDPNKTFMWYLSNEISRMMTSTATTYSFRRNNLKKLGDGVLYDGGLLQSTCTFGVRHEMRNGSAVSVGILTKKKPGSSESTKEEIGVIFDSGLQLDPNMVFKGRVVNNLCEKTPSGTQTIILKDIQGGLNNCNAIWMDGTTPDDSRWNSGLLTKVGVLNEEDSEDEFGAMTVIFNSGFSQKPKFIRLDPVILNEADTGRRYVLSYRVSFRDDGVGNFTVTKIEDDLHLVVEGLRYKIDMNTGNVYYVSFRDIAAYTMDFTTKYTYIQLRENLLTNIRQYMMNEIVQKILDNGTLTKITPNPRIYMSNGSDALFLDLFSDSMQLDNFYSAGQYGDNKATGDKFYEVYKNNINDIDDSRIGDGKVYKYLDGKVRDVFQNSSSIILVDEPSVDVKYYENVDKFTYVVHFDLYMSASKRLLQFLCGQNPSVLEKKYMIGNAVIRDMTCQVTFVPEYVHGNDPSMKYSVSYLIPKKQGSQKFECEYNRIIYILDKKAKIKTIPDRKFNLNISNDISYVKPDKYTLDHITEELVSSNIESLFTEDDGVKSLFVLLNNNLPSAAKPVTQVGYQILKNNRSPASGGIWNLGTAAPVDSIFVDEGSTFIDGIQYRVIRNSDGSYTLKELNGSRQLYVMRNVPAHILPYDTSASSHPTTSVDIARGQEIVSNSDLQSMFILDKYGVNYFLRFRRTPDMVSGGMTRGTPISFPYSSIQNKPEGITGLPTNANFAVWTISYDESEVSEDDIPNLITEDGITKLVVSGNQNFVAGDEISSEFETEWNGTDTSKEYVVQLDVSLNDVYVFETATTKFTVKFVFDLADPSRTTLTLEGEQPVVWVFQDLVYRTASGEKLQTTAERYEVIGIDGEFECDFEANEEEGEPSDDEGGDDEDDEDYEPVVNGKSIGGSYSFMLKFKKTKYDVFLSGSESYLTGKYYYDDATRRVVNVLPVTDMNGYSCQGLNYGYVDYPYNESLLGSEATFAELKFKKIYFSRSGTSITSAGYYCPCTVQAIPPDDQVSKTGDIYNRHFDDERIIEVSHLDLTSEQQTHIQMSGDTPDIWMDQVMTTKSIGATPTHDTWKGLVYNGTIEDSCVPQTMRERIVQLKDSMLRHDNDYFGMVLRQLQTYLQMVNQELNQTIAVDDVLSRCVFKYDVKVSYPKHETELSKWKADNGLFGYGRAGSSTASANLEDVYQECLASFNNHLYNDFYNDFSTLTVKSNYDISNRDYHMIMRDPVSYGSKTYLPTYQGVMDFRTDVLEDLYKLRNTGPSTTDRIHEIFGNKDPWVRYINRIRTSVYGNIIGMFVCDEYCNILTHVQSDAVSWYKFLQTEYGMNNLLANKCAAEGDYTYSPEIQQKEYGINGNLGWKFRFANRDFSTANPSSIQDAFVLPCRDSNDSGMELWYLSTIDGYLYAQSGYKIVDIAYEQYGDTLYVIFSDNDGNQDGYIYRYDHPKERADFQKRILLKKENADMKIETFHSVYVPTNNIKHNFLFLDYKDSGARDNSWTIKIFGTTPGGYDCETWSGNPGELATDFKPYNNIMFGDSLFDSEQLKFQNISKNKDMFDILDINEIDGCYYGLFKDELNSTEDETLYTVFKTSPSYLDSNGVQRSGVVQRLPYQIVDPNLYRTSDDLYSLYVVEKAPGGKLQLRELSVPDSDLYVHRIIPLQDIMGGKLDIGSNFGVNQLVMDEFKPGAASTQFFVLSNISKEPFHRIFYENKFGQASIDTVDDLNEALTNALREKVIGKHMAEKHNEDDYFKILSGKINQFAPDFGIFSLIPTEFDQTQDIGVIPDSKVDDTDTMTDHRQDSIQVSTDILWTDGMVAETDTNPGLVTAAVANPSTTYDSDYVFTKSQRNPSIEGTEFYDYIYDQDGEVLMDLYQIPFIYLVNTNNTYDLYINVPTTRTKYLNRIAGTLKEDGTSQVLKDDTRTRLNFLEEAMPNNLDESTTRLRIYIDRKYVSIGNVELVEISGNSIPLQIYRDTVNNGLYDSIALESRWNGEVNEINEPANDINKVMLEFECYGTDSQSIHIQGKTLINRSLDDNKYVFG